MLAIETYQLTKTYQGRGGCREISLTVPQGSVFGLIGPNGAGKSTLVKMLVGLLQPTAGEARLLGKPLTDLEVKKRIGFLPEKFNYHDWLTGEELLRFHASLYRLSKAETERRLPQVLAMVGLSEQRTKRVGSYSKGMQQRIGLACALIADPDILFLDEPSSALDPIGRKMVRDLTVSLKAQGKTVFINSHLLGELETVCDRIAVIKNGRLTFQGDWREITAKACKVKVVIEENPFFEKQAGQIFKDINIKLLSKSKLPADMSAQAKTELVFACREKSQVPQLVQKIVEAGINIYEVSPITDSLEKIFIELVKGTGRAERR